MLRLWPNQCLISLSLDKIEITQSRGVDGNVNAPIILENSKADQYSDQDVNQHAWQTSIAKLDQALINLQLPKNTALKITLGSDLVRYVTLPAHNVSMSSEEKLSYANALYHETYGAEVSGWLIKCNEVAPSKSTVASAIDQPLLTALEALASKYQLKISSLKPYFVEVFNAHYHTIKQASCLLVIVETNRFLVINVKNGACKKIKSYKFTENLESQLLQTLEREKIYAEDDVNAVFLYAPIHKELGLNNLQGCTLTHLNTHKRFAKKNNVKQMTLDFIEKNVFSPRYFSKSGLFVLLLSITVLALLAQQYQARLAAHQHYLNAFSAHIKTPASALELTPAPLRTYNEEDQQEMQEILVKLAMPWNKLLNTLEQVDNQDLSLLSLEPNIKDRQMLLKGQSKNLQAILTYVKALEQQPMLSQVYLQKHQVEQAVASKPVNFEIITKWQR